LRGPSSHPRGEVAEWLASTLDHYNIHFSSSFLILSSLSSSSISSSSFSHPTRSETHPHKPINQNSKNGTPIQQNRTQNHPKFQIFGHQLSQTQHPKSTMKILNKASPHLVLPKPKGKPKKKNHPQSVPSPQKSKNPSTQ